MSGSSISLAIGATDQTEKAMKAAQARVEAFAAKTQAMMNRAMAPVSKGMAAVSGSIDKVSARFETLGKRVESALAPVQKLYASIDRFRDASGINRIAGGFRNISRAGADAFLRVGQLIPLVGIVTSAATIAGMTRMVSKWGEWGLNISNVSRSIGVGAKQLVGLQGAANLAGGSADAMASGLEALGQGAYDALGGRNPEYIVMMRTLKIAFDDGFGHARKAADMMPEIVDKIASIRDPFARAQAGVTLFGGAWKGIEPVVMLGSKRMAELQRVSEQYSYTTDKSIEKAKDLELAQREVSAATEGLRNRIAERLSPILTPMLERFANWIATSPLVTRGVEALGRGVVWLGNKLEHIDWDKLGQRMDAWGERLKSVLAVLQRFGIVPDLSGVFGGKDAPNGTVPTSPSGSGFGTSGPTVPPPTPVPDSNPWITWGRNIGREWNPFHWTPWYHPPMQPGTNAPNGIPQPGPRFGPQQTPSPGQAPGGLGSPPANTIRSAVDPANADAPRGIRNNNPLNLGYVPGQAGLVPGAPSDGRFGRYQTMADGVAAAERQLMRYQTRDHLNTVRQMVTKWAPPGENNTESYVQQVARSMGVNPDAPISLANQATAAAMISAMARRETGRSLDPAVVNKGVGMVLNPQLAQGAPMKAPQAQGAPMTLNTPASSASNDGKSTVRVEFGGDLPRGMNMRLDNPQKVDVGGPLVERPQLLGAMP